MYVKIQITYLTEGGKTQQSGSFSLRGRQPVEVAYEWMKQIKRTMATYRVLLSVIVDGKEDITEEVNELLKAPLNE